MAPLLLFAFPDVPAASCDAFSPAVPVFLSAVDVESLLWHPILASLLLVDVTCAEAGPAVAVFLSAVVSSLGSLHARIFAMAAVSTAVDASSITNASNASRFY